MVARRGITASITELLIVAITFSLLLVVASFVVLNVHGQTGSTHRLVIYGDSYLYVFRSNNTVYAEFKVYSDVKPAVVVEHMVLGTARSERVEIVQVLQGDPYIDEYGRLVLPTGTVAIVRFYFPGDIIDEISPYYYGVVEAQLVTSDGALYKVALKVRYG